MFRGRNNARVLNGDFIEGFEGVDRAKRFSIFLQNAKPTRAIGGIGRFVDACIYFSANNSANLFKETRGYRNVFLDPRDMIDNWKVNRREEICAKTTTFSVIPCETFILLAHKIVEKIAFFFPEEW